MSLSLVFTSLCTSAGNTVYCISLAKKAAPCPHTAPVLSLSDGLHFGSPPCLKIKVVEAATRVTYSIVMLMVVP